MSDKSDAPESKEQSKPVSIWRFVITYVVLMGAFFLLISLTLTISLTDRLWANEAPLSKPSWSQEDQKILQNIHTILVAGTVQTWLNVPSPPYNVGITLKLKLEDAGFQVVFDPKQPHDAIHLCASG